MELLIAVCLCNHNHLTSIKLSSGDLTGRNTNFIRGQHLDISSFTFFDLCADRLSSTRKIFLRMFLSSYIFYLLFLESQQTVSFLFYFYNNVHASYHLCGHTLQIHLKVLLSFEPPLSLPVSMTMTNRHGFLRLLALSHLTYKSTESEGVLYLRFWIYFFSNCILQDHCFYLIKQF